MIKLLVWKICFEWWHFVKLLGWGKGDPVYYFAYGANINEGVLRKRKISPLAKFGATLPNHKLDFSHRGPFIGMGFGNLVPEANAKAYGIIYQLSKIDRIRMDYYEFFTFLKKHKKKWTQINGVEVYFYYSSSYSNDLKPTQVYKEKLISSYKKCSHVPEDYISKLESLDAITEYTPDHTMQLIFPLYSWMPALLRSAVIAMEKFAMRYFERFYYFSVFNHLLKKPD